MMRAGSILPRRRPQPNGTARPQLTSLVDMMVILLVFLLKSFSVEGQLVTPSSDLRLPESSARTPVAATLSLEVTTTGINLDGRRVASLPSTATGDSLAIAPLQAALVGLGGHGAGTDLPPLAIQCDRRLDFAVLKRVLYTCNQAGCADLSLLVLREGS